MSELNAFDITVAEEGYCEGSVKYRRAVYDKSEADNVIAEKDKEIRRLQRALWLARAYRAMMTLEYFTIKCRWLKDYMKIESPECDVNMIHNLYIVERKCLKKSEEYK